MIALNPGLDTRGTVLEVPDELASARFEAVELLVAASPELLPLPVELADLLPIAFLFSLLSSCCANARKSASEASPK